MAPSAISVCSPSYATRSPASGLHRGAGAWLAPRHPSRSGGVASGSLSTLPLIVTTHSDILVDALTDTPESVVVCEKENGQTTMKRF